MQSVRVERYLLQFTPATIRSANSCNFAKVYLVGLEDTADVCVACERDATAKVLAQEIAAAAKLPREQVGLAPFDHQKTASETTKKTLGAGGSKEKSTVEMQPVTILETVQKSLDCDARRALTEFASARCAG